MSYGEIVKMLLNLQDKSNIPFDIQYNSKEKTIKIQYESNS